MDVGDDVNFLSWAFYDDDDLSFPCDCDYHGSVRDCFGTKACCRLPPVGARQVELALAVGVFLFVQIHERETYGERVGAAVLPFPAVPRALSKILVATLSTRLRNDGCDPTGLAVA